MGSLLLWDVTQRGFVVTDVSGKPTGPIFKRQALLLETRTIYFTETSVTNYQSTLRRKPSTPKKGEGFPKQLSKYNLLQNDSAPRGLIVCLLHNSLTINVILRATVTWH